jgi:hypothetical protein
MGTRRHRDSRATAAKPPDRTPVDRRAVVECLANVSDADRADPDRWSEQLRRADEYLRAQVAKRRWAPDGEVGVDVVQGSESDALPGATTYRFWLGAEPLPRPALPIDDIPAEPTHRAGVDWVEALNAVARATGRGAGVAAVSSDGVPARSPLGSLSSGRLRLAVPDRSPSSPGWRRPAPNRPRSIPE